MSEASSLGTFRLEVPASQESRAIPEAFPWGPQMVLLFCVFGWLVLGASGDLIPQGAAVPVGLSLALLAALSVILIMRRRARRVALVPIGIEVGVYREGRFAYRFPTSALRKDSWDWFYPVKMLVLIGLLVLLTGGLLAVELHDLPKTTKDFWVFAYLFGYACFAFAAIIRSQFLLVWYWIPEGPEGGARRVGFPRRQAAGLRSRATEARAQTP